jgi:NADH-quinone oxidoreductase subunit A
MQDLAATVHGGFEQRPPSPVIFGLNVIGSLAYFYVGVVTEKHAARHLYHDESNAKWNLGPNCAANSVFRAGFDRPLLNRYYTVLPMSSSGLQAYAPLVLQLLIAGILATLLTTVSVLIGWRRPNRAKLQAYECGMEPTGDAREPFSVKFYLVAMVFILFDVEAIFLYPWAYVFRSLRWYGFVEMMVYIAILLVGYLYLWKKGALDWHK